MSFIIIAYNQEKYIRDAVVGAFSQTFSPLEIILSDDCSSDKTFEIMEEMVNNYKGQHEIILNRNNQNLGLAEHVNKVMSIINSDLVILAAGDDISLPDRARVSWDLLNENSDSTAISFSTVTFREENYPIKETTRLSYLYKKYSIDQLIRNCDFHINGSSRTFRKSTFEMFGPLSPDSPTEDSTILLRCLLAGQVIKHNAPLVHYRLHGNNLSATANMQLMNYEKIHSQYISDLNKALDIGHIDDDRFQLVEKSLVRKLERRMVWAKYCRQENKIQIFISSILFSKVFSLKEKMNYLRKTFRNSMVQVAHFFHIR